MSSWNTRSPLALETASAAAFRASFWWLTGGSLCVCPTPGGDDYPPATIETSGLQRRCSTRRDEDVPRPADRLDGLRIVGVVLDLAPQARDADVDRAVERLPFAVAGQGEELVARQHPVRVLGEGAQQVELHRRERDVLAARADQLVAVEVELAIAEGNAARGARSRLGARLLGPAQHALHAREQLAQVEGLADVVVGAHFQPDHAVDHIARRGEHDDRHVVAL